MSPVLSNWGRCFLRLPVFSQAAEQWALSATVWLAHGLRVHGGRREQGARKHNPPKSWASTKYQANTELCELLCVRSMRRKNLGWQTHTAEPNVSYNSITGRHAGFVAGISACKFSNIRVKRPSRWLSLLRDGTFKDPVKRADIPNEPERKPRRNARRGKGHGWAARVPINLVNDSVGRWGDWSSAAVYLTDRGMIFSQRSCMDLQSALQDAAANRVSTGFQSQLPMLKSAHAHTHTQKNKGRHDVCKHKCTLMSNYTWLDIWKHWSTNTDKCMHTWTRSYRLQTHQQPAHMATHTHTYTKTWINGSSHRHGNHWQ